jgi:hypothetical protein
MRIIVGIWTQTELLATHFVISPEFAAFRMQAALMVLVGREVADDMPVKAGPRMLSE